jgi:acid phosphatase type 7
MSRSSVRARSSVAAAVAFSMLAVMPVARADTVTVATAGDIARTTIGDPQVATARVIADMDPAMVFVLGDAQYEHGEYANFMRSYDPTWGTFKAISAPVAGNHEYETPNAAGYFDYFSSVLSGFGPTASNPSKGYYSFDVGDWHVVALNSNCSVAGVSCSEQRSWLKADLEADTHLCEIVFFHHAGQKAFAQTSANLGVDLALAGHRHTYERWDRRFGLNLRMLIVGTGGKSLGSPASGANVGIKAYGVGELTLNAANYSWRFVDIAGNARDVGSDTCHS